jgi:hypothetical protein
MADQVQRERQVQQERQDHKAQQALQALRDKTAPVVEGADIPAMS